MGNRHKDNSENLNQDNSFPTNSTTGSGFSEAERAVQDGTNVKGYPGESGNLGSDELVDSYNINDKAHSDSSVEDFIKTTSNYHHAEDDDSPENDGRH
jgi:hypothetical protein